MPELATVEPALLYGVVLRGWFRLGLFPREAFTIDMAAVGDSRASRMNVPKFRRREQEEKNQRRISILRKPDFGVSQRLQPMTAEEGFSRVTE